MRQRRPPLAPKREPNVFQDYVPDLAGPYRVDLKTLIVIVGLCLSWWTTKGEVKSLRVAIQQQQETQAKIQQVEAQAREAERATMLRDIGEIKDNLTNIQAYLSNVKASLAAAGVASPDGMPINPRSSTP